MSGQDRTTRDATGFVFAATGAKYTVLARRAARTLRLAMPDAQVDLFTDQPLEDSVFDSIHMVREGWFRPKMEALRGARFERTIYLDADVLVLQDISEVFELLEHCDIAGALGVSRIRPMIPPTPGIPRAAPLINGGVLAIRSGPEMHALLAEWERLVEARGLRFDQSVLRELILDTELRFLPLPYEYNLKHVDFIDGWSGFMGAPRVLHVARLRKRLPGDPLAPFDLVEAVGERRARHLRALVGADWSLGGDPKRRVRPPTASLGRALTARRVWRRLRRMVAAIRNGTRSPQ